LALNNIDLALACQIYSRIPGIISQAVEPFFFQF
jgi:hypothetical protein